MNGGAQTQSARIAKTDIRISTVLSATDTQTRDFDPQAAVNAIRSGEEGIREQVEAIRETFRTELAWTDDYKLAKKAIDPAKKRLPAVTWSGTFTERANDKLISHSGLLCADLDHLGARLKEIREKLLRSPHVWAVFLSPSGDGLKVVFRVPADASKHEGSFCAVEQHVKDLVGVQIDKSCKDVCRLCFVSYDPEIFHNPKAIEIEPLPEPERPRVANPGTTVNASERQRIATEILGSIDWESETSGGITCPGKHLHTTGDGVRDCMIDLDQVPTVHCFHNSCRGILEGVNHELRSRIGKAEYQTDKPKQTLSPFPPPIGVGKVGKQESPTKWPLFPSASLLPQEGEETEDWLVADLLAKETVNMLVGPPGNFKTYFTMVLSRCVGQGEPFLDRAVEAARVIYIDKENPKGVIKKRMKQIGPSLNYDIWPLWAEPEPPMLGNKAYLDLAVRGSLIIFDSMRRFHGGSENAPEEMAVVMKHLRDLTTQGATVLVLHHAGKAEGNAYRGSTENLAGIDAAFSLEKTNQPRTIGQPVSLSLRCLKHRIIEEQTWDIEFEVLPDGHAIFRDVTAIHQAEAEETRQETLKQVAAIIRELQNGELPTQTKVLSALKEKMGIGKNRALKILATGEGGFWVSKAENGSKQYKTAFPLSPLSHTIGIGKGERVDGGEVERSEGGQKFGDDGGFNWKTGEQRNVDKDDFEKIPR